MPARARGQAGGREIDLTGHYVLPGFVDLHGHIGGVEQGTPAEYVYKLWLGHGITTIRDPGCGNGIDSGAANSAQQRRQRDHRAAHRALRLLRPGPRGAVTTPEQARDWVRDVAGKGADGIKFFGCRPDIIKAALDEAKKLRPAHAPATTPSSTWRA